MKHKTISVNPVYINTRLGTSLDNDTIIKSILKMRLGATLGDNINVTVPPYRVDIMRDVDVAEDVAMAIGYDKLGIEKFQSYELGKYLKVSLISRVFRDLSIGAGFQEIYSLVLTKSTNLMDDYVKILNPISTEYDAVRNSLIWTTLSFLSKNQHSRFPIKVFEVGDVVNKSESDTGYINETRGCFAIMDSKVSFENLQSLVHQVLTNLVGIEPSYLKDDNSVFIKGRGASISIKGNIVGIIGEVNPEILTKFEIYFPVVIGEIYLSKLNNLI
jgi:phenylalanyl-tRNA synthetase beta chain